MNSLALSQIAARLWAVLIGSTGLLTGMPALAASHAAPGMERSEFDVPTKFYSEAEEALYKKRFEALARGSGNTGEGLKLYDILEPVPGAQDYRPLPVADKPTIPAKALDQARDYAAANNSSALIVWRNGKVERAEYFGDATPETLLVSRSLAKPVTVLATGRAIAAGKIQSLDQSVADFITEWRDSEKAKIRVRYLLDMRSGSVAPGGVPGGGQHSESRLPASAPRRHHRERLSPHG
jgi:CubicO group peptidase (beta-lactamase class C family)